MKTEETTAVAPELYAVEQIAVDSIDPSPANKRKFSDDDRSLRELGDSIEAQGLLQAIVVRESPDEEDRYELVAGERRWRAFRLKGWVHIPAVVRILTDAEAHDITASENLQREDLSPIEEAESIKVLLDDGRDAREIADRLGKPVSWVVRRARIADLSPKWIKAISDPKHPLSKWSATHLELVARYEHNMQDELMDQFNYSNRATITVKELERMLNEKHLTLSSTPWKLSDEALLPSAGACTTCQKRTSCAPDLFEPIEDTKCDRKDRCLDRECWEKKLIAHHGIAIKIAREKHQNLILMNKNVTGTMLPYDHPWKKQIVRDYKYDSVKKTDKGAIPAYIVDGPGAGRIEWKKLKSCYAKEEDKARKIGADGKPLPKTLEERREGLEKRRIVRFINKLMLLLQGEDPDMTGKQVDADAEGEGEDRRVSIVENLSHIETHALVAAFGAISASVEALDPDGEYTSYIEPWERYRRVVQMNGGDAIRIAAYGAFHRIVDQLRQCANVPKPDVKFPDALCEALRLDRDAVWAKVIEEIPEPKGWGKIREDGEEKPEKAKRGRKRKSIAALVDEEDGDAENDPESREE